MDKRTEPSKHIVPTSYPPSGPHRRTAIAWGAQEPEGRGPVVEP
jgi:hypothetical protein